MNRDDSVSLLPRGFVDLLPCEAEAEAAAIHTLMGVFGGYGYRRIKPPLVEFEDSLFAPGPGAALPQETFRVLDPLSHRMMGVRSDPTAQIARISGTRMADSPRPLRLAYANDVLRTKGSQHRTERQFCKAGCEIIGIHDEDTDVELCVIALLGLKSLGIHCVTLDLVLPDLIAEVLALHDLSLEVTARIREALNNRDIGSLQALDDHTLADILVKIVRSAGPAEAAFSTLDEITWPDTAFKTLQHLKAVYLMLKAALDDLGLDQVQLTVDPAEYHGHEYHHGVAFTIFGETMRGALGRGGGYYVVHPDGETREPAAGFTLYMDTVRKAMPNKKTEKKLEKTVDRTTKWSDIQELVAQGYTVVRES